MVNPLLSIEGLPSFQRIRPADVSPALDVLLGDAMQALERAGSPEVPEAIRDVGFAGVAFGVDAQWTDRISRYERIAEVRIAEFGAHVDDEVLGT